MIGTNSVAVEVITVERNVLVRMRNESPQADILEFQNIAATSLRMMPDLPRGGDNPDALARQLSSELACELGDPACKLRITCNAELVTDSRLAFSKCANRTRAIPRKNE